MIWGAYFSVRNSNVKESWMFVKNSWEIKNTYFKTMKHLSQKLKNIKLKNQVVKQNILNDSIAVNKITYIYI